MSKSSTDKTAIAQHPVHDDHTHAIYFITGTWRKRFTSEQCKIIIAEALNYCTRHHGLIIKGYLITDRKLCLVMGNDKHDIHRQLKLIFDYIRKELNAHFRVYHNDPLPFSEDYGKSEEAVEEFYEELFFPVKYHNDYLIKLITGENVKLPYYNPRLERLRDFVRNHSFCSAVDYAGAKGPVTLKK